MVNELRSLLHESADNAPYDAFDTVEVLRAGRSRIRHRRAKRVGIAGLTVAAIAVGSTLAYNDYMSPPDLAAAGVPQLDGKVLRLSAATPAVEGDDYRVLTSYTNEDLNEDNGQYLDGLTDDGFVVFRDGPRRDQLFPRYALMDPATGEKDWLPNPDVGQMFLAPVELGTERLVFVDDNSEADLTAYMFDRDSREWSEMRWPGLPRIEHPRRPVVGPDGRMYVVSLAMQGQPSGRADEADADGSTYDLWSVSLTDSLDARDEGVRLGDFTFTDDAMVWTDRTNGAGGLVHVRDLATGEETTFDPMPGDKCNLNGFGASRDRIVLGQYCGTYKDGVRDDRVQVFSMSGEPIVTLQDSGIFGWLLPGPGETDLVQVSSYLRGSTGTYVYDLSDDSFVRVSDSLSHWSLDGLIPEGHLMWGTSANWGNGATQTIVEWQD